MKSISVTDLKLVPELSHLNYFEMIAPENDYLVNPFLEVMGFDLCYPLQYMAKQHRNLQNKVVINYLIIGEVNINRKHLTSEWSTLYDRMVAAAYQDPSLCKTLCEHMNTSLDYSTFHSVKETDCQAAADFPSNLVEPNEDVIATQIKQLEDLLFHIRGSQYLKDGSLKMPSDYHEDKELNKQRTKSNKKLTK